jgi:hypothetical protein
MLGDAAEYAGHYYLITSILWQLGHSGHWWHMQAFLQDQHK